MATRRTDGENVSHLAGGTSFSFDRYLLDTRRNVLCRDDRRLASGGIPLAILGELVRRAPECVSRRDLETAGWGQDNRVSDAALNQQIRKLRRILGDNSRHPRFIESVPGEGYRFVGTLTPPTPEAREMPSALLPGTGTPLGHVNQGEQAAHRWVHRVFALGFLSGVVTLGLGIVLLSKERRPERVAFNFDNAHYSPSKMAAFGFQILNPRSLESAEITSGLGLTLMTWRGDLWRKRDDPVLPPADIVSWPTSARSYVATTELVGFEPRFPHQQAGILVLEGSDTGNYIRLTVGYASGCPHSLLSVQAVAEVREVELREARQVCVEESADLMGLQIRRANQQFDFRYHVGEEWEEWQSLGVTFSIPQFGQQFVAMTAFQGITTDSGQALDHPPVEARFGKFLFVPNVE